METASSTVWTIARKYGIILGLIAIIYTLAIYFISVKMLMSWWVSVLLWIVSIAVLVMAGKDRRKELGGFMTYKQALQTCFAVAVIYSLIYVGFEVVLHNVIDTGMSNTIKEMTIEKSTTWMEKFGMSQEQIDKAVEEMEKADYGMGLKNTLMSMGGVLIFGFILSAIVAAFIKKNPTQAKT